VYFLGPFLPAPPPPFIYASKIPGTTIPVCYTFTLYLLIRKFKIIIQLHIWTGHIWQRKCLLKPVTEGNTEKQK
jgi:uncharacterized membrane protein